MCGIVVARGDRLAEIDPGLFGHDARGDSGVGRPQRVKRARFQSPTRSLRTIVGPNAGFSDPPRAPAHYEDRYLQDSPPEPRSGFLMTKAPRKGPARSSPQRTQSKRLPPGSKAFARQTSTP